MEKKRIYKYDNLKFLLIILVIVGHMIDFFNGYKQYDDLFMIRTFIYSVHMPAFIFLSGLFYKEKDTAVKAFQFFFDRNTYARCKFPFADSVRICV